MASYSHLTKEERLDIDRYLQQGFSFRRIGLLLGRSSSTISREIRRNMKRWKHGYVHDTAITVPLTNVRKNTLNSI